MSTLFLQDLEKLLLLSPKLEEEGLKIVQSSACVWKIFHQVESSAIEERSVQYRHPFCDIFIMRKQRGKFVLGDKASQALWPGEFYSDQEVEGISWEQFGDFTLPCPANPEEYLARYRATYPGSHGHTGRARRGQTGDQ